MEPYNLTATQALFKIRADELTVEAYATSLLNHISHRDESIKAWAYLDPEHVLQQARSLDAVPKNDRGPLHGIPIGIKDIMYTKDMPTQFNSPIYKDDAPKLDAASVKILRQAGALIFGKTTTTEFAATTVGPRTSNAHSPNHTPGGSSAGSAAAVASQQVPLALATQTGGSTVRPASFNGIYGFKPTWNAISREGQRLYATMLDTIGFYARCVQDFEVLADVFGLEDDEVSCFQGVSGARFAACKTMVWEHAGPGTKAAIEKATSLLRSHGATVSDLTLPPSFARLPEWHHTTLSAEGRAAFLPEYRIAKDKCDELLITHVENLENVSRKATLQAFDRIAALRPMIDEIAGEYDAILVPSVPDEAPEGLGYTGDAVFCSIWTALHVPVINIPGFKGTTGLPIGVTLVAPRYRDRHLLKVSSAVGEIFEARGGWKGEA